MAGTGVWRVVHTRRRLLRAAIAVTAAGMLRRPAVAVPSGILADENGGEPTPIPGGVRNAHFFVPQRGSMVSTVNNFTGVVGVADLMGTGSATLANGTQEQLTFRVDNRFMVGSYLGIDGQQYTGTFAELWLTLWRGQFGTELLHDFHPPVPTSGLFWTVRLPAEVVEADLNAVSASMRLQDLSVPDAGGSGNAIGPPPAVAATVSLVMQWGGAGASLTVRDALNGFAGTYQECQATIEW